MPPAPYTVAAIVLGVFAAVVIVMIAYQIIALALGAHRDEQRAAAWIRAGTCPGCGRRIDPTQSQCPTSTCQYWFKRPA